MQKLALALAAAIALLVPMAMVFTVWPRSGPATLPPDRPLASLASMPSRATEQPGASDPAPIARDVAAPPAATPRVARMHVLVVDGRTGQPEPGAEVLACVGMSPASLSDDEFARYEALGKDAEARARRFGTSWRTGEDGSALVPRPSGWGDKFTARAAARYGEARATRDSEEVRIELHPDHTLRAHVVGPHGEPMAAVALQLEVKWPETSERGVMPLGSSDATGELTVPHLQARLLEAQRTRRGAPESCRLMPHLPGLDHEGVDIDPDHLATEPVVVRLPATGKLAVEVWKGDEPFSTSYFSVSLRELSPTTNDQRSARDLMQGSFFLSPPHAARIVYPQVALGARFRLQPTVYGMTLPAMESAGPMQAGEEVVVRCAIDETVPILLARLVDERGALARREFFVSLEVGDQQMGWMTHTDDHGTVRLPLGRRCEGQPLRAVRFDRMRGGMATGVMARAVPERARIHGSVDLGTIHLAEPPRLAAGILVDDAEHAIDNMAMEVRPADAAGQATDTPPLAVSLRIDADGRFTVRGLVAGDDFVLTAKGGSGFAPGAPIAFRRGAGDLRVVLRRLGKIVVEVAHDLPEEPVRLLRLEAVDVVTNVVHAKPWSSEPRSPNCIGLTLSNLEPGCYAVQVRLLDDPVLLATVDGVEVGAGVARDPRLRGIDLRGRLRLVRVHVLDDCGQPVRGDGRLLLRAGERALQGVNLTDGAFLVPLTSRPVHGTIRVQGWRDCELSEIDGDRTVRLQPELEVRVRLVPDLALPPGVTLHAFARPKGQGTNIFEQALREQRGPIVGSGVAGTAQDERGVFTFALAQAGEHEFTFVLAGRPEIPSVALAITPSIATLSMKTAQQLVFTVDEAQVQEALQGLTR